MPYDALIAAGRLHPHLAAPGWVVFDCRFDLTDPGAGEAAYRATHLPGARFADLGKNLSAPPSQAEGRHPMPEGQAFSAWLAAQGVNRDSQVVAYDGGAGMAAARLWFLLKAIGHQAVAVLDGGLAEWNRQGLPLTADPPQITPGNFQGAFDPSFTISLHELVPLHADPALVLIDARSAPRFEGREEPLDPVAGHIPGSRNAFCGENVDGAGCFLPPQKLRERFQPLMGGRGGDQVIHYCGSGVAACHNALAMAAAGLPPGRVYIGSWSQWCADPRRPVETGGPL